MSIDRVRAAVGYVRDVGGSVIAAATATTKGLIIRGAVSQTENLQEWQDSAAAILNRVAASGAFSDSGGLSWLLHPTATIQNNLAAKAAGNIPLVVRAAVGQTASLQQWANSAGADVARVDAGGRMVARNWQEVIKADHASSGAVTFDWSIAGTHVIGPTAAMTVSFANNDNGCGILVRVNGWAGSAAVTWPAGIIWAGGVAPTLAVNQHRYLAFHAEGGNIWGTDLGVYA